MLSFTDFLDEYMHLNNKTVSWMQWSLNHCPEADWIIKADDDMTIDAYGLNKYLMKQDSSLDNYHCRYWVDMPITRGDGPW